MSGVDFICYCSWPKPPNNLSASSIFSKKHSHAGAKLFFDTHLQMNGAPRSTLSARAKITFIQDTMWNLKALAPKCFALNLDMTYLSVFFTKQINTSHNSIIHNIIPHNQTPNAAIHSQLLADCLQMLGHCRLFEGRDPKPLTSKTRTSACPVVLLVWSCIFMSELLFVSHIWRRSRCLPSRRI